MYFIINDSLEYFMKFPARKKKEIEVNNETASSLKCSVILSRTDFCHKQWQLNFLFIVLCVILSWEVLGYIFLYNCVRYSEIWAKHEPSKWNVLLLFFCCCFFSGGGGGVLANGAMHMFELISFLE